MVPENVRRHTIEWALNGYARSARALCRQGRRHVVHYAAGI